MGNKKEFSNMPFDKLRKTIERHASVITSCPVREEQQIKYTDEELFSREMGGVQEIAAFRRMRCDQHHPKEATPAVRPDPDREALAILDEIAGGQRPMHLPDTQEYVEWISPEYCDTIIPELHAGQFSIQAAIDLHGCTVPEAEDELQGFLGDAFAKGLRCVKVVHGRGLRSVKGPRLKDAVLRRLAGRYQKNVIAYVSARQCDGGLGALYVLLKKK